MAGMFFSRGFSKCSRNYSSFSSKIRFANQSRSKADVRLQRSIHSSQKRKQASLFHLNTRITLLETNLSAIASFNSIGLLNKVQTCGLHVAATDASNDGSNGITTGDASAEVSDNTVDPLSSDAVLLPDFNNVNELLPFEKAQDLIAYADVPLSSLGLGGYTPVGLIQTVLDFSHQYMGLPWWGSIVAGTLIFRALIFPIMVKGQVNSSKLAAIKPELEKLQEKLREVSNFQNPMAKVQASMELQELFKKHDCHPAKALIAPLIQLPLFVSFFLALRKMAYLPVESMKVGGCWWFQDLTAADPFYILPVACAATMLLTIETGAEAGMANPQMKTMKNVFRGMCVVMVPLTYQFPTAIFLYWMTSNIISLVQVVVMKVPAVKSYFGIPDMMTVQPVDPNIKQGNFFDNFRAGYKNAQEVAIVKHQEKMKKRDYELSLKDTYQETFEYNPRVKQNEELFKEAKKK